MLLNGLLAVKAGLIVLIVVLVVLIAATVALTIYGKKLQKRQAETQQQIEAAAQSMKLLIIDKKRMKIKDSGLPQMVIDQTPKRFRGTKVPIVKVKAGPKVMSMMCDEKIFPMIPVKKEVRARVSGIYILDVKGIHGSLEKKDEKLSFGQRMRMRALDAVNNVGKKK
ncbi:MAG: hypothetical protein VZR00_00380 [Lachnospiraceae bacterium]|nr:hypothetical protein [Lachnospiraceae bacterium]MEE3460332.1 hypothetical protein [Lachnospiraceae bacterium]